MKIKLNLEDSGLVDFLDSFFDQGFRVENIEKEEFDSLSTKDIMKFNL